jgi:4-alpha-glucanotransferase
MPERVWESQLVRDIVPAGMQYTILDDQHFRAAGWSETQLTNYFLTEDDGQVLRVFPGSERLRYLIPFAAPEDTINYCRTLAERKPGSVVLFGDDGEKFGTWPDTYAHVYEQGWLKHFFQALDANRDWLKTSTPQEVLCETQPAGRVFLPDCSYREMTEWALPVEEQAIYDEVVHMLHHEPHWDRTSRFIRGGYWRNFRVKYSEANEMYCRMIEVSRRLELARRTSADPALLPQAEDHLYRGQCNCPYWHGAFGGIYLPHLRNATFRELIAADTFIERASGRDGKWVEVASDDYDKDLMAEVKLSSDQIVAYVAPSRGGMIYELDMRQVQHNLLATIQRRPEFYHRKVLAGDRSDNNGAASIHDRVVFKQQGLEQKLVYDAYPRKSLQDHFFDQDVSLEAIAANQAMERGDFVSLPYTAKLRRGSDKAQVLMKRDGNAWGVPLSITKSVTLHAGQDSLKVSYLIEGLPPGRPFHFASEWNFAGMPTGANDRFYFDESGNGLGQLGTRLNLAKTQFIGLIDRWLGVSAQLIFSKATAVWAYSIESVSQSEGGFEGVHQSVCVMPHWIVQGDVAGKWSVQMEVVLACEHDVNPRNGRDMHALSGVS